MSLTHIEAPFHLHTNSSEVIEAGIERGGQHLLETLARPIGSYTGIEVRADIVQWLKDNVEAFDSRFRYAHWNVHHLLYNASAGASR
jgi:hypothetical protein